MQVDKIVEKIIDDAKQQVEQIKLDTTTQTKEIKKQAQNEVKAMEKQVLAQSKKYDEKTKKHFEILSKIDCSKLLLQQKQQILQDIKDQTIEKINCVEKREILKFVEKILKENAVEKDNVKVLFKNCSCQDVKTLSIVKKLKLKVVKGEDLGVVISNESYDKNFSLVSLVNEKFECQKSKIIDILFA